MGLIYYRVKPTVLADLRPLIEAHESELVGPRARGYWFDRPDEYDYLGVRDTARALDEAGRANALEQLELSEVQAHSLSLLDITLPSDGLEFPPALFMSSVDPVALRRQLRVAHKRLGDDPETAAGRFVQTERDPRFSAYLDKQMRHLRETLPAVWRLHEHTAETGDALLVVDLRARDLEIPEEVELLSAY
ncbi:MAG: hypothetical protein ABI947_05820 [Chloroflexota bacterium]